jgi:hypothetical protein
MEVKLHISSTSALNIDEWLPSQPRTFKPLPLNLKERDPILIGQKTASLFEVAWSG